VLAAAIAPDETWIAIGSADGTLRFVDAASGHLRRTLNTHTIMRDLAVTADGRLLVTIGTSPRPTKDVYAELATTGTALLDWTQQDSAKPGGAIEVWDIATEQPISVASDLTEKMLTVSIATTGTWIAAGDTEGTVHLWSATTGRTIG